MFIQLPVLFWIKYTSYNKRRKCGTSKGVLAQSTGNFVQQVVYRSNINKAVPVPKHHAMKAYRGREDKAPLI